MDLIIGPGSRDRIQEKNICKTHKRNLLNSLKLKKKEKERSVVR